MNREEMERLAHAVLDGSARDDDVKRLAKAVLDEESIAPVEAHVELPTWLVGMTPKEREQWRGRLNAINDVIAAVEQAQEGKRQ